MSLPAVAPLLLSLVLTQPGRGQQVDTPVPDTTVVGTVLPAAPSIIPGRVPPVASNPLSVARQRWQEGDANGVIAVLSPWLESRHGPWGRVRSSGYLLLGTAHMQLGNWNLASRYFYRVRRTDQPLASYGAWYEALVDHKRGRHLVAVRECRKYRDKWPDGPKADECLLLTGDAYSAQGMRSSAIRAYNEYVDKHPDTPRREEIRLAAALAVTRTSPKSAIPRLHGLMLDHSYPSTDLAAKQALAELAAKGYDTALPDDPRSLMRRAWSLRRSGKLEEAWDLFTRLAQMADDDKVVADWVEANEDRFTWATRRYDLYAKGLEAQYEAAPSGALAWGIFQAWGRSGDWARAAEWGRKGMEAHGSTWQWRTAKDDMAWATMLAGEYSEASDRWEALGKAGGAFGPQARFYAAFCALEAGENEDAIALFEPVLARANDWRAAGYYWRAKAHTALGHTDEAAQDRARAIELDDSGWYTLLIQNAAARTLDASPNPSISDHDGRWHGAPMTQLPDWRRPTPSLRSATRLSAGALLLSDTESGYQVALDAPPATQARWDQLSWPRPSQDATPTAPPPSGAFGDVPRSSPPLPDGYVASDWYDPQGARKAFYRFAEAQTQLWPDLKAAYDLANAGLYDESAHLVFDVYEEWRAARADPSASTRAYEIASLPLNIKQWRQYVLYVHDHYHAARTCAGLDKYGDDEDSRLAAARLAYPIVRARALWRYGQVYDIDPYLILAIMRQESTYHNTALSPAGAVGLVQVMPRTGAKVAAMLGEQRYSPRDLEDPAINLRYGTFYFSRLMDRFDGAFPLAVASYNGGPHNISQWYAPQRGHIDTDAMVEQIRYDESRDYVKKVTGHYAQYVARYEPDSRVIIPLKPTGDDPSIIDF